MQKPPLYKRAFSFLLDILIIRLITFPFDTYFLIPQGVDPKMHIELNFPYFFLGWMFYQLVILSYFAIFEYVLGSTPGKHFYKLKIVTRTDTLLFSQTLLRSLFVILVLPFWIFDFFGVFSKSRDRFLERVSKTTVICK
jgi:uncharacterized RDD family membrane protein YckC